MKELSTIQTKLKAPKGQYNNFGKYKYRSCEDILEAVKPLLAETECTLIITDDIQVAGNRIYVKATATLKNANGETETATAFAREEETKKGMDGSQVTGAASSYARKYALNGLFAIDDNKDSDTTNTHGQEQKQQPQAQAQSVAYTGVQLKEALDQLECCNTRSDATKLWNEWAKKCPALCAQNGEFYKAVSAKMPNLPEA